VTGHIVRHWAVPFRLAANLLIGAAILYGCTEKAESQTPGAVQCARPYVHDGDYIRCDAFGRSRLYGIDAPEMPGACRPGRTCVPGDPYDSRDNLRALVAKGNIMCRQLDTDRYGRPVLQCWNEAGDLSCQQVAAGQAVPRHGRLECPPSYQSRSPE
jgi:endonuclease YncB( thermonuclease family)